MINRYPKGIMLSISVVVLLVISSIGSMGSPTGFNDNKLQSNAAVVCIKSYANSVLLKNSKPCPAGYSFGGSDNIVVANDTGNESYPSMIINGYRGVVAYNYEYDGKTHVYLRNSGDYGQNWSSSYFYFDSGVNTFSPSLCTKPFSTVAYGAAVSDYNNSGVLYDIDIQDISQLDQLNAYSIDWSTYGFWNFSKPDIIYYSDSDHPDVPFITAVIGSTTYSGGAGTDIPMFFYRTPNEPGYYTISWDPGVQSCSNLSITYDASSKTIYGVCEIKNETKTDIFLFYDNPLTWGANIKNQTLSGTENLTHPQIFLQGNQIYIVTETDTADIVLYNSSDKGKTWNLNDVTKDILPPSANPKYPMIYADDTKLFCTFMDSSNISITNSTDYGSSWNTPMQLNSQNNSVVEDYRYSDFPDLDHIVWTDNREGNNDIYSALLSLPTTDLMVIPGSVNITRGEYKMFLPTRNWITFTVKNNGGGYVENVPIEITYTCQNVTKSTNYPASILFLDGSGAEESFTRPLFRITLTEYPRALKSFAGIQNITVTVDPDHIYPDSNPGDNSATLPVKYADIFPKLSFLEKYLIPKGLK